MSYWIWDSSLDLGIDVIDGQHRRIVTYINELEIANRNSDNDKVTEVIIGLVDYTITHFAFEESLMEKAGYPILDAHKKVHQAFIDRINEYRIQHQQGKQVTMQLMYELKTWLINHIKQEDKDYSASVKKSLDAGWVKKALGRFFK